MLQKISISSKYCSFELSVHQRILKRKMYQGFHKNTKQHNSFFKNIDNNMLISISEWFLKDHVTLKTGVMMLKIQLWSKE